MATHWPLLANSNYESGEKAAIHRARLACDDPDGDVDIRLWDALDKLERALRAELTDEGRYRSGLSAARMEAVEEAVLRAWETFVQEGR